MATKKKAPVAAKDTGGLFRATPPAAIAAPGVAPVTFPSGNDTSSGDIFRSGPPASIAAPVATPVAPSVNQFDPSAALAALYGQPAPTFSGANASAAFAPVLADLEAQKKAVLQRGAANNTDTTNSYNALQGYISGHTKDIQADTAKNVAGAQKIGADTQTSIGTGFKGGNDALAQIMALTGSQAAAPDAMKQSAVDQAFLSGLSGVQSQNAQGLAQQLGANAANYNQTQANNTGFAKNDALREMQRGVEDRLSNIGSQSAQTKSQQGQAANQMAMQQQSAYLSNLQHQADSIIQQYAQRAQLQNQLDVAGINAQKSQVPTAYQRWQMTAPGEKVATHAGQLFGDANKASTAINLATKVAAGANYNNPAQYIQAVLKANQEQEAIHPGSGLPPQQLQALAQEMFTSLQPGNTQYGIYDPSLNG